MRADRPLLLLLAALTAGCADPEPFVEHDPRFNYIVRVDKPRDTVLEHGYLFVCYSDATPWAEVETLARERCASHGLQATLHSNVRQQCRATSPHRATFLCYDPEMTTETGGPVNPFNPRQVTAWEKRTGKTAKPHNFMTLPGGPAANPAAPPEAAPATAAPATSAPLTSAPVAAPMAAPVQAPLAAPVQAPLAPLTPADIAGHPPYQPAPLPAAPAPSAPPAEAYPPGNFTLPQGSWGDAFQE